MHYLILYSPNTTYKIPIGVKEIMLKREAHEKEDNFYSIRVLGVYIILRVPFLFNG